MTIDDVIRILSKTKGKVDAEVDKTIRQILSLSLTWSYKKADFTFDVNADLDSEVNRLLMQMSDNIMDYSDSMVAEVTQEDDDKEAVVAFTNREIDGEGAQERADAYASHLKYLCEAYLAACFSKGMSTSQMLGDLYIFLANPNGYYAMRDALRERERYKAALIRDGGAHFGSGKDADAAKGLTRLVNYKITEGFHKSELLQWSRKGNVIGYRCRRGSNYPCAICDDVCAVPLYPLTEQVLPVHPDCCCYMIPIYAGED